jgi:carbamoyl-phosphate synthase large subunit
MPTEEIRKRVTEKVSDERLWEIAELMRRGVKAAEIHAITKIDLWFLDRIARILYIEKRLSFGEKDYDTLLAAKVAGFPDREIARLLGAPEREVKYLRGRLGIKPAFNMVDTCAGRVRALTPYFYSNYAATNEAVDATQAEGAASKGKVLVLGSGPIRMGRASSSIHAPSIPSGRSRHWLRNDHREQQPRDGEHRLRRLRPALLRAAYPGGRREHRGETSARWRGVQFGGQTAIKLAKGRRRDGRAHPGNLGSRRRPRRGPRALRPSARDDRDPRAAGKTVYTT